MALLFLSRIDAHMGQQTAALERIAEALGAHKAAEPEAIAEPEKPREPVTERFFVEPERRNPPRRPKKKGSGEWRPGPCPTHAKLLDENMMCVDCHKELDEWTKRQQSQSTS
jgi:hypothetical protein